MKKSLTIAAVSCLLLVATARVPAQLKLSPHSRISNPTYLRNEVRNISDGDLFRALRLQLPGLRAVDRAARSGAFPQAYQAWASYWRAKRQPSYVTQTDDFLLDTDMLKGDREARDLRRKSPAQREEVLTRAGEILRNVIHPWGDTVIDFGPKVDFDREIGQSGKYGFHYWYWARPLNEAYVLTGDQQYLAKFDQLFNQWYSQRNTIKRGFPEFDVVYYELGLGTRNRIFIEYYLQPFDKRPWQTDRAMLKTMLGAGRWLYELERWEGYRAGNWQIHGSYMLAQIAMVFPEFAESNAWFDLAAKRLREHLHEDFFEDGGHSERSPRNYTQATYLAYRNLYYLLTAYHRQPDLAAEIRSRMGNTIDWWITMLAPTGEIPAINDSHRGLFPSFILLDGAEFFRKPYVYGVLHNLFGMETKVSPLTFPPYTSRHMPASGFTVMRTDWTRDALYMNINYGKWNGAHTHNDLLDFELYAYGKALAVDAGIGMTYDDPLYATWYKSSRAHNMVTVNDQSIKREGIEGEQIRWSSGKLMDYFSGEHKGYETLGVANRRQIIFVKPLYWIVLDDLECEQVGDTLSWYFHTPALLERMGRGFQTTTAPGILILPAISADRVRTGTAPGASTTDFTPGKTEQMNWIALDQFTSGRNTKRFNVLLMPYRDSLPSVEYHEHSSTHFTVSSAGFSDDIYVSSGEGEEGDVASDAAVLLIHREKGTAVRYSLVEGTYLRMKGKEVWRSAHRTSAEGQLN